MPELRVVALIFDMDGVVIDSGDVYARHWREWGAAHGLDYDTDIDHVHHGRPPVETIRTVAPHLDALAEAARFTETLEADWDAEDIRAMPGAADLLASLPQGRWAIATSAFRSVAVDWLAMVGLPEPAALVTVDDIERGKPAPDPYLRAAELLGVEPGSCLVVEDAPAGISAGKAAGATVLALETTHGAEALGEADHRTAGLHTVEATVEDDGLIVRWEQGAD